MEEDKKRSGSGIFLGVVAVATLIVAIIGATFAYFSISLSSNEDAVNFTAYEYAASLSLSQIYPESAASLIPLAASETLQGANTTKLLYAVNSATNRCIDDHNLQVCAVYSLTFINSSANEMTFSGVIRTVSNVASTSGRTGATAFQNLKYQALTGSLNSLTTDGSSINIIPAAPEEGQDPTDQVAIGNIVVPGNSTVTKYIAIYLDDVGDQSNEMGASYQGQLIYTAVGAVSTLTGTFTISGN